MEIATFQDVMTCMVKIYQHFGEICCACIFRVAALEDVFGVFL
jgi:hypothetical protein